MQSGVLSMLIGMKIASRREDPGAHFSRWLIQRARGSPERDLNILRGMMVRSIGFRWIR